MWTRRKKCRAPPRTRPQWQALWPPCEAPCCKGQRPVNTCRRITLTNAEEEAVTQPGAVTTSSVVIEAGASSTLRLPASGRVFTRGGSQQRRYQELDTDWGDRHDWKEAPESAAVVLEAKHGRLGRGQIISLCLRPEVVGKAGFEGDSRKKCMPILEAFKTVNCMDPSRIQTTCDKRLCRLGNIARSNGPHP